MGRAWAVGAWSPIARLGRKTARLSQHLACAAGGWAGFTVTMTVKTAHPPLAGRERCCEAHAICADTLQPRTSHAAESPIEGSG